MSHKEIAEALRHECHQPVRLGPLAASEHQKLIKLRTYPDLNIITLKYVFYKCFVFEYNGNYLKKVNNENIQKQ